MLRRIRTLAAVTLLILATLGTAATPAAAVVAMDNCLGTTTYCP